MCVAKFLHVPKIPVVITVRHPEWILFKQSIEKYAGVRGAVYAPLMHMDLQNIKSYHSGRIEIIAKHISSNHTTVLDIGAHWGYHSKYLTKLGKKCLAVEKNPKVLHFLHKLKVADEISFDIFAENIFNLKQHSFDVVLALRIFHHFLKRKNTYNQLKHFLRTLEVKELYFQPHDIKIQKMPNAYKNFDTKEFLNFILYNSCLNSYQVIGEFVGGKEYKLCR